MRFDPESKECTFYHPVSGEETYRRVWEQAIADENIQLFKEFYGFTAEQLDEAMDELRRIRDWCVRTLDHSSRDYDYMTWRIDTLLEVIPEEAKNPGGPFELI